jgi:flagellar biogenesis protein FliO
MLNRLTQSVREWRPLGAALGIVTTLTSIIALIMLFYLVVWLVQLAY